MTNHLGRSDESESKGASVKPTEQKWWKVTRRYLVEEAVYVAAESATEAKQRARNGEYEDVGPADVVSPTTYRKATPLIGGKPQEFWTASDWEAEGE